MSCQECTASISSLHVKPVSMHLPVTLKQTHVCMGGKGRRKKTESDSSTEKGPDNERKKVPECTAALTRVVTDCMSARREKKQIMCLSQSLNDRTSHPEKDGALTFDAHQECGI